MIGAASSDRTHSPPPVTVLVEGSVSVDLAAQCAALGLRVASLSQGGAEAGTNSLLAGRADPEAIERGLAPPFCGFVELGCEGLLGVGLRCFETARAGGFCLSLLTSQVYTLNMMGLVSGALRRKMNLPDGEAADLIDIGVGEALCNAVIHGNLAIPSHLRTTSEGFEQFRLTLRERLTDPVLAHRRVEINVMPWGQDYLTVAVSDQGGGFDVAAQLAGSVHSEAKSGRGLGLIRKICAAMHGENDGRTMVMTFSR